MILHNSLNNSTAARPNTRTSLPPREAADRAIRGTEVESTAIRCKIAISMAPR